MLSPRLRSRLRTAAVVALPVLAVIAVIVVVATGTSSGPQPRKVESIFQDDRLLLTMPAPTALRTLRTIKALGADRVRLNVQWFNLAPSNLSLSKPPSFNGADPAQYPQSVWVPYDRVVRLAHELGLGVDFDVTAPGPLWAMARGASTLKDATHFRPSAQEYGAFVTALGRRYSGGYVPPGSPAGTPLPRVSFWTFWNEPNQPGWLLPQSRRVGGQFALAAPAIYRQLVDAGYAALKQTGHSQKTDTILIGELAPEGNEQPGFRQPIPPLTFLRALYCVSRAYQPLQGAYAISVGCPAHSDPGAFVTAHPGLFDATGFAHHPYSFFLPPSVKVPDPNFVPLANLGRLEDALDRVFMTYDPNLSLPVYLTEYGYETNPPNPYRGVSLQTQALYLDEAQYMVFNDLRVHSFSQFLLEDSAPDRRFRPGSVRYWSTFQTGLAFLGGRRKPSFNAYRLPLYIPNPVQRPGGSTFVWAMLRAAPNNTRQVAQIQWRPPGGGYRTVLTILTTNPDGFLATKIRFPASGSVRLLWASPGGVVFHSRVATVTVS